ncbi:hypothetical protein QUF80_12945, partial [Desulfococcaceae bacterium HSG8]|nr:hypothetical protein [Desulfococcaceae bacterium HSG8]
FFSQRRRGAKERRNSECKACFASVYSVPLAKQDLGVRSVERFALLSIPVGIFSRKGAEAQRKGAIRSAKLALQVLIARTTRKARLRRALSRTLCTPEHPGRDFFSQRRKAGFNAERFFKSF